MEKNMNGLCLDLIIHPGETLKEAIEDKNMTQEELAVRCNVSPKHVSEVISGKKNISNKFAVSLEYALGINASFWINLQGIYDREILELERVSSISNEEMDILSCLKDIVKYCENLSLIPKNENKHMKILNMRRFLNVNNLTNIPDLPIQQVAFRGTKNNVNIYVLYAWQKICESFTERIEIENDFSCDKLKNKFTEIKSTMFLEPNEMVAKLKSIFSDCGVAFEIVKNFKGAPVQGFIKKTENRISLCMTLRQSFSDIFWFTLFHEIGHLINGDFQNQYIDYAFIESETEKKADEFAANALLNEKNFKEFLEEGDYSTDKISKLAKKENVIPSIVIGRLQRELKDYSFLSSYKVRYKWSE